MSWSADQVAIVRANWGQGKSAKEIADLIGKSRNAVIGKAHRLGLKTPVKKKDGRRLKAKRRIMEKPRGKRRITKGASGCQWLDGEPRERQFCGAPRLEDSSYCEAHHARCWIKHEDYKSEAA